MSDTRWTPGPWALSRYHFPHRDIVQRTGSEDNDARPGGRHICAVSTRDKAEQSANAHLIAAAPELYEALEDCVEIVEEVAQRFGLSFSHAEAIAKDARAILDKARGKS